jgi:hypothetical protein
MKVLGVDKKNIKKGVERHLLLDTSRRVFLTNYKPTTKSNALSQHYVELIVDWWTSETTIFPNRKDIVWLRVSRKQFEVHPMHYLQVF